MSRQCPLCGRGLPRELDEGKLKTRLRRLAAPEASKKARKLAEEQAEAIERKVELKYRRKLRQVQRAAEEAQRAAEEARRKQEREIYRLWDKLRVLSPSER